MSMKVSELIAELQKFDPGMTVMARLPEVVYVDNRSKPGVWNQLRCEICRYLAVKL